LEIDLGLFAMGVKDKGRPTNLARRT
jgi:hypothetical protein